MIDLKKVPADLPMTDPLLFSWLVVLEASGLNIKMGDYLDKPNQKDIPAFEYAVNNWTVVEDSTSPNFRTKKLQQTVLCALWKDQPPRLPEKISWSQNPDGTELGRKQNVDYLYRFEDWRNQSFRELELLISLLLAKGERKRDASNKIIQTPADYYDFELLGGTVNYIFAKDTTSNQYFGVGATFTLQSDWNNYCPKADLEAVRIQRFKDLGFIFPDAE